ncbi:collagen alpha [Sesbania bispinosa]|nr:collagen alpha [Sesbania bispinosa]
MKESKKADEKIKRKNFCKRIQEVQGLQKIQEIHFHRRNMIEKIGSFSKNKKGKSG